MKFGKVIRVVIEVCMQNFESLTFPFPEIWRHKFLIFMKEYVIAIRNLPHGIQPNYKKNSNFISGHALHHLEKEYLHLSLVSSTAFLVLFF